MTIKAYIICDTAASCVPWKELYNPAKYQLILMVDQDTYDYLKTKDELQYFSKHVRLTGIQYTTIKKTTEEIITELSANGIANNEIMMLNNDESLSLKCGKVRDELNIQGPREQDILPFKDKVVGKERLKEFAQYLPKYLKFDCNAYKENPKGYIEKIAKFLEFPIYAKPIDLAGSLGTGKINDLESLKLWCERNKDNEFMELDEFIEGDLYHCDSFVSNGKIIRADVAVYLHPCGEFLNGKPLGGRDLPKDDPFCKRALEFNELMLRRLTPPDGCTHLEFFRTKSDRLIYVECAARTPGGLVPQCRSRSNDIALALEHYRLRMGLPHDLKLSRPVTNYSAWVRLPRQAGILMTQFKLEGLASTCELTWESKPGDLMKKSEYIAEYAYAVILTNTNYQQLIEDLESFNHRTLFTVGVAPDDGNPEVKEALEIVQSAFTGTNPSTASMPLPENFNSILGIIKQYYSNQVEYKPGPNETSLLISKERPKERLAGCVNENDASVEVQHFYRGVHRA